MKTHGWKLWAGPRQTAPDYPERALGALICCSVALTLAAAGSPARGAETNRVSLRLAAGETRPWLSVNAAESAVIILEQHV